MRGCGSARLELKIEFVHVILPTYPKSFPIQKRGTACKPNMYQFSPEMNSYKCDSGKSCEIMSNSKFVVSHFKVVNYVKQGLKNNWKQIKNVSGAKPLEYTLKNLLGKISLYGNHLGFRTCTSFLRLWDLRGSWCRVCERSEVCYCQVFWCFLLSDAFLGGPLKGCLFCIPRQHRCCFAKTSIWVKDTLAWQIWKQIVINTVSLFKVTSICSKIKLKEVVHYRRHTFVK